MEGFYHKCERDNPYFRHRESRQWPSTWLRRAASSLRDEYMEVGSYNSATFAAVACTLVFIASMHNLLYIVVLALLTAIIIFLCSGNCLSWSFLFFFHSWDCCFSQQKRTIRDCYVQWKVGYKCPMFIWKSRQEVNVSELQHFSQSCL